MDRRAFIGACFASVTLAQAQRFTLGGVVAGRSLVPEQPSNAPNYWCTWAVQNYMYGHGLSKLDPEVLEGDSGSQLAHNAMNEHVLLAQDGWAHQFHAAVRKELLLLLDDGWEAGGTATFELDTAKFPSFTGDTSERLKRLNEAIQQAGWRNTALWCRNTPGGEQDARLERISQDAGIPYWKIDIGDPEFHLVPIRNQNNFGLTFEHVNGEIPVNGEWRRDGRFGAQPWGSRRIEILRNTDVYRTYDVTSILSVPTTLDRLSEMLKGADGHSEIKSLLNVEDEAYIAAVMGCTMGIMRHSLIGKRPGDDLDLFFNGPRRTKKRMDEVVRAIRWQRIAKPFSPGTGSFAASTEVLTDAWKFSRGQTWQKDLLDATVRQGAPAILTRNIALPQVRANGDKPFVFAARFPNGAIAVGAHERTQPDHAWYMPACDVTVDAGDAPGPIGIFGNFTNLSFAFNYPIKGKGVLAQDLADDEAIDITKHVRADGNRLHLTGDLIQSVGLKRRTPGDESAPGMVLAFA